MFSAAKHNLNILSKRLQFQEKCISNGIHLKCIAHVIAGIESIGMGGVTKHVMLERLIDIDQKTLKKWLVRKDAKDYMELYYERIMLDEHYTR